MHLSVTPARVLACVLPMALALVGAGNAFATTYFVEEGGDDGVGNDCIATPCGSVQRAIEEHRIAPQPDDVIEIAAGDYAQNIEANDPDDDGLTIRGSGSGTDITGDPLGGLVTCDAAPCVIALGASGVEVQLEDMDVDTTTTGDDVTPISIEGGSDLRDLDVWAQSGTSLTELVFLCDDEGSEIDNTLIDGRGTNSAAGVTTGNGFTLRDSAILVDDDMPGITQDDPTGGTQPIRVIRSWVDLDEGDSEFAIEATGDLVVDSSLITGGLVALTFSGTDGGDWQVRNSTIDVGLAGENDPGLASMLLISPDGAPTPIDAIIDSSLLVENLLGSGDFSGVGPGSMTCTHSDFPDAFAVPGFTSNCTVGSDGNTATDPDDLFVGFDFFTYDWSLRAGSPAIDTGNSAPLGPGESSTDFDDDPRVLVGLAANCPGPARRDKGAYERFAFPCDVTAPPTPTITDSDPNSPANDNEPEIKGTAEGGSTVRLYATPDCTGTPLASGLAGAFGDPGLTVSVPDYSTTTLRATATDVSGNTSACSAAFNYVEDSTPAANPSGGGDDGGTDDPDPPAPPVEEPKAGNCANVREGTEAADLLEGTAFGDLLRGLAGADVLRGGEGNDCLEGAGGADRLSGSTGDDWLWGGDDDDRLFGRAGRDRLRGGDGIDRLSGHDGDDGMKGGDGDDLMRGGDGDDYISGGNGEDRLYGHGGTNRYFGGRGDDRVFAANGVKERVNCGPGNDMARLDPDDTAVRCETQRRVASR